jgi:hypothetical protein
MEGGPRTQPCTLNATHKSILLGLYQLQMLGLDYW